MTFDLISAAMRCFGSSVPDEATHVLFRTHSGCWELMPIEGPGSSRLLDGPADASLEYLAAVAGGALGYPVALGLHRTDPTPGYYVTPAGGGR